MKLLLDENLSRRLVPALQDAFPGTSHVVLEGLEQASDRDVWDFAKNNNFIILTKDDDFAGILSHLGFPPKVVMLKLGNGSNQTVLEALRKSRQSTEDAAGAVEYRADRIDHQSARLAPKNGEATTFCLSQRRRRQPFDFHWQRRQNLVQPDWRDGCSASFLDLNRENRVCP